MSLTIFQWNAQSLKPKEDEFLNHIFNLKTKPDLICLQETKLDKDINFQISGYIPYRKDRNRNGGAI